MAAVGYDLYCELVAEAVADLKGETPPAPVELKLEIPVGAHLPGDYVEREDLRLEAYRRLATVVSEAEVDDVAAEWEDRYGPVPPPATVLLDLARLRVVALERGVREVVMSRAGGPGRPVWQARLAPVELRASRAVRLERLHPGSSWRRDTSQLIIPVRSPEAAPAALRELVVDLLDVPDGGDEPESPDTPGGAGTTG